MSVLDEPLVWSESHEDGSVELWTTDIRMRFEGHNAKQYAELHKLTKRMARFIHGLDLVCEGEHDETCLELTRLKKELEKLR